jgi:hypothetical protein
MKTDTLLKKLLAQKKEIVEASKVSAESIDFWEAKAEKLFAKMDEEEAGWSYTEEGLIEAKKYLRNLQKNTDEKLEIIEK